MPSGLHLLLLLLLWRALHCAAAAAVHPRGRPLSSQAPAALELSPAAGVCWESRRWVRLHESQWAAEGIKDCAASKELCLHRAEHFTRARLLTLQGSPHRLPAIAL